MTIKIKGANTIINPVNNEINNNILIIIFSFCYLYRLMMSINKIEIHEENNTAYIEAN
jgi:hypothetical protein